MQFLSQLQNSSRIIIITRQLENIDLLQTCNKNILEKINMPNPIVMKG